MEWTIDYLEEDGIIFAKISSPVNIERIKQLCEEIELLTRKHNSHKYLVDHRGVEIVISVLDIDNVPGILKEIGSNFEGKTAVMVDSSAPKSDLFNFLKNVLSLASMQLELFSDEDKALAWLRAD